MTWCGTTIEGWAGPDFDRITEQHVSCVTGRNHVGNRAWSIGLRCRLAATDLECDQNIQCKCNPLDNDFLGAGSLDVHVPGQRAGRLL